MHAPALPRGADPAAAAPTPAEHWLGVAPARRRLAAGELLFRQGDACFGVFRLRAGRLRLLRFTPCGAAVPMHAVRAGELFAEASLFAAHYHCDAQAQGACEVLVYPKPALLAAFAERPQALLALAAELAQRVQGLRQNIELRQIRSARERLLQLLRLRCDRDGRYAPEGTLKQLAEEIGLTHEALYRALAALEREGALRRREGRIELAAR